MEKYLSLSLHAHNSDDENDLQHMIYEGLAAIKVYFTNFHNIKSLNAEIFQVINLTLNPTQIARTSVKPIQAAPQISMPGRFKS